MRFSLPNHFSVYIIFVNLDTEWSILDLTFSPKRKGQTKGKL